MHREVWKRLELRVPSQPKRIVQPAIIAPNLDLGRIRIKSAAPAHSPWARKEVAGAPTRQQRGVSPWDDALSREESLDSSEFKQMLRGLGIK